MSEPVGSGYALWLVRAFCHLMSFIEIPRQGKGFVAYNRDGNDQWGEPKAIHLLTSIFELWQLRHPEHPVYVGDISRKGGVSFRPVHKTHTNGRDVDMRPLRHDGANLPLTWRAREYSRALTKELIEMLRPYSEFIYFNDPQLVRLGLCRQMAGHDNHLHIRLKA